METPGQRILKWREYLGLSPKDFVALTGIPYSTLKTLETDPKKGKPSFDVISKLRKACPQLNTDWLFDEGDSEPMLREDRQLVASGKHFKLDAAPIDLHVESNQDGYKYKYDALLELVTKGFFGSPEQLLKGLGKKIKASADAADLHAVVDKIAAKLPKEIGFGQAGRQRQLQSA